jgi:hypothetical protein
VSGKKTYVLGGLLIAYVIGMQVIVGEQPDPAIVAALLGGMGLTLRHAIASKGD